MEMVQELEKGNSPRINIKTLKKIIRKIKFKKFGVSETFNARHLTAVAGTSKHQSRSSFLQKKKKKKEKKKRRKGKVL